MNHKKLLCAILAALLALAWGVAALAKTPSPSKEFYYYDEANVLSEATRGEIFFSNELLYNACGAQIVIAAVRSTGGESMSDYTYDLFNSWGVGSAETENGFLLVMSIEDDDYYAACGDNLQPKLTSSTLKDYFDDYLEADFADKNYDAGARKFFEAIFARIANTYNADVTVEQGIERYQAWKAEGGSGAWSAAAGGGVRGADYDDEDEGSFSMTLFYLFVVVVILASVLRRIMRRRHMTFAPPPPPVGRGGYRGVNTGNYRGPQQRRSVGSDNDDWLFLAILNGFIHGGGGGSYRSSGSSRSSRSSSHSSRSFGSSSGGGGHSSGGGAGRGRH